MKTLDGKSLIIGIVLGACACLVILKADGTREVHAQVPQQLHFDLSELRGELSSLAANLPSYQIVAAPAESTWAALVLNMRTGTVYGLLNRLHAQDYDRSKATKLGSVWRRIIEGPPTTGVAPKARSRRRSRK